MLYGSGNFPDGDGGMIHCEPVPTETPGIWECPVCGYRNRLPSEKPFAKVCSWEGGEVVQAAPMSGPGTELHSLLESYGVKMTQSCQCASRMHQMNQWGAEGCEEHFEEIVAWLVEAAKELPLAKFAPQWTKRLAAEWLVREAIRRATHS